VYVREGPADVLAFVELRRDHGDVPLVHGAALERIVDDPAVTFMHLFALELLDDRLRPEERGAGVEQHRHRETEVLSLEVEERRREVLDLIDHRRSGSAGEGDRRLVRDVLKRATMDLDRDRISLLDSHQRSSFLRTMFLYSSLYASTPSGT
jgi:hypothetical protein